MEVPVLHGKLAVVTIHMSTLRFKISCDTVFFGRIVFISDELSYNLILDKDLGDNVDTVLHKTNELLNRKSVVNKQSIQIK
jgi:hypothetical protein